MLTYDVMEPTFADRETWSLPQVLRHRVETNGDSIYLDVPFEGVRYTYREMLELAQRVGSGLLGDGAERGDRVLIMAPNCSQYILTWFGTAFSGLIEVPINTAYRGAFLEHQVRTVGPTAAVIHADYAERFVESQEACKTIRRFYLLGPDDAREVAAKTLQAAGWESAPFEALTSARKVALQEPGPREQASVFFTSGTTG